MRSLLTAATRRLPVLALLLAVATPSPAAAHESADGVAAVLDAVTPDVDGVTVEVQVSIATQLVVENTTGRPVDVLDPDGATFLRITSDGAFADLASPFWYRVNDPLGIGQPPPAEAPEGLTRVSALPSWGWFDHRLHPGDVTVSDDVRAAGEVASLGTWEIPIRYGDQVGSITGRLEYRPLRGRVTARLEGDGQLPGGGLVTLLPGVVPGFFLQAGQADEIVVVGAGGEPMLRLRGGEVAANLASPSWHEHARLAAGVAVPDVVADASAAPVWEPLPGDRVAWLDPRTAAAEPADPPAGEQTLLAWEIPMRVDGAPVAVAGETVWQPLRDRPAPEPTSSSMGPLLVSAVGAAVVGAVWWRRRRRDAAATGPAPRTGRLAQPR